MKQIFFILGISVLLAACNKDSDSTATAPTGSNSNNQSTATTANDEISADDASEAITNAVSGATSGMAAQSENTATMAASSSIPCGQTKDTSVSGTSPWWAIISYTYSLSFSRTTVCTNGVETGVNATFSGYTSYSAVVMSSDDTTSAQASVSGLDSAANNWVLNETYTRKGTQQSQISTQHSFNSTVTITSTNITISKQSKKITSGTATVQFNGTSSTGKTYTHSAAITFLGNNQATLVVDNGTPKTINW